ncbi:MAG: S9 family peptidase [bacterium]|nr:S9 family peptidase [bacterium]
MQNSAIVYIDRRLTRRLRQRGFVLTVLLALITGAGPDASVRDHDITIDDYFTIAVITDAVLSPDGRYVAYTEMRWEPPAKYRNTDLWVVDCETRQTTRLTFERAGDTRPRWSPDGQWIYFTSARSRGAADTPPYNGKKQVWRVSPSGGPIFAVTRLVKGMQHYDLSADARTLYYTVGEKQVDEPFKKLIEEHKDLEYGQGVDTFSQVWKLDLQTWRADKVVDERRVIRDFAVAPDERRIAMITTPTSQLISHEGRSRVDVYDRETGEVTSVEDQLWRAEAPSPYGWLESPTWSGDGNALAFTVHFDGYPSEILVARWAGAGIEVQKLDRPMEVSVTGARMQWRATEPDLCFVAEHRARTRVYCITDINGGRQGESFELTPDDVVVGSISLTRDGNQMAVVTSTPTHPPDVYLYAATPPAAKPVPMRLTRANLQVDTWKLPKMELVSWKGYNGDEVEGILELPPDHQPGDKPLPMVVQLHGGPTASAPYCLRYWIYGRVLLAAKGYALLSPNYRGSTGYGDKFLVELVGHKNDRDVADILAGVDAMVERGIADPDRLGVTGWSNGGFLTNCLISRTDRFKAASSGAGVVDVAMQWSAEDTPGHVINFQQGHPWDRTDQMRAASPLYRAQNIKTPTIIHVGQHDARHIPEHSRALFRALHEYLDVPAQLIVYPDEGHGLTTYAHRKAKLQWDLAWFEKYLPVARPGD